MSRTSARRAIVFLCLGVLVPAAALAEDGAIEDLSLDELLSTPVQVATRTSRQLRQTPGVVTVVTRDEILAWGARDLTDVLERVPGFWFGVDANGVVGVGTRGLWGHEGKVLLRIDGFELNETLYSTLQFGHRFPIDQIDRIEIIRGPGSAVFGGFAELAVIDVTTRGATLNGAAASLAAGAFGDGLSRAKLEIAAGKRDAGGWDVSAVGALQAGQVSTTPYTDLAGVTAGGDSARTSSFLSLGAKRGGLELRMLWDDFRMTVDDGYADSLPVASHQRFRTLAGDGRWSAKASESLTFSVRASARQMTPWQVLDDPGTYYDKSALRLLGQGTVAWEARPDLSVLAGLEATRDDARLESTELRGFQTDFDGSSHVSYWNLGAFAQALWDTKIADVALGVRLERHEAAGSSFVPRVAITRVFDRLHVKVLGAFAFRPPGIENIRAGAGIRPELTRVFEAEAGYRFGDHLFVSANVFDTTIDDPIVYTFDEATGTEGYRNYRRTGSRGLEAEARWVSKRLNGAVSWSFASAAGKNEVDAYAVPGAPSALLGMPENKLVAWVSWEALPGVLVTPGAILAGKRWAYTPSSPEVPVALPAAALVDVVATWKVPWAEGLSARIGLHDLLGAAPAFVQPYAGGHAPLPRGGREAVAHISYDKSF